MKEPEKLFCDICKEQILSVFDSLEIKIKNKEFHLHSRCIGITIDLVGKMINSYLLIGKENKGEKL